MHIGRIFSGGNYKGGKNYIDTQKKYEIFRTALYFGISLSLFLSGWVMTKSRLNLLTVVAILGCLPASKSAVGMIMFLRFKSCSEAVSQEIERHSTGLACLYDCVFTSYHKNFPVAHLTVKGKVVCGYTEQPDFDERAFDQHITGILRMDHFNDMTVKIFKDLKKYTARLDQLKALETAEDNRDKVLETLKSVAL